MVFVWLKFKKMGHACLWFLNMKWDGEGQQCCASLPSSAKEQLHNTSIGLNNMVHLKVFRRKKAEYVKQNPR